MNPPLVMHIIHRLAIGGLENGLVNLINQMPSERYRHAIVCLTDHTEFRERITRKDVALYSLHKREGHDFGVYKKLWRLFRDLRPDIVHTRNLSGLEYLLPAALSGVTGRVHGEHGRDMQDLTGQVFRYNLLRRVTAPVVDHYIAVSTDLAEWLVETVGIGRKKVTRIYNGVDSRIFHPRVGRRPAIASEGFAPPGTLVLGTVGRMEPVKNSLMLVQAFLRLRETDRAGSVMQYRLVMVGDGTLRNEALRMLREAGADHLAWLPGDRGDIPEILRGLDLFVLPSLAEGISNTILEAMATGLPVVASRVGGNPELVEDGVTGVLVPLNDTGALAQAVSRYLIFPEMLVAHGRAGREKVAASFSMESMVQGYLSVYDEVLRGKPCAA